MSFLVNQDGYYGEFGGAYVPEILHKCVEELQNTYLKVLQSEDFKQEFDQLLRDYVGRPSPLYYARRLSEKYGCKLYLKREDLNHTGAHKINNTIGQILLARRMGKHRIIAETGAGQHGVATATVCALMNMECIVYMGKTDVERQHVNVEKMKMLGATVIPVTSGNMTLKDATNEGNPRLVLSSCRYVLHHRFHSRSLILIPTWWLACNPSSARKLKSNLLRKKAVTAPTILSLV